MATAADWMSAGLGVTLLCIFLHKGWFFILGTFTDADPLLGPIKSTLRERIFQGLRHRGPCSKHRRIPKLRGAPFYLTDGRPMPYPIRDILAPTHPNDCLPEAAPDALAASLAEQRREAEIGRRFDQPIPDTVLLSAILFGQSTEHTLDTRCDRLAISIPEKDRHTAIGTADAFAKMIPMMQAAGLPTLGAAIEAFDKHSRLIRHLN
jgi:hypothetical protein